MTRSQQKVLAAVLALLVLGWAVKAYRAAHPPPLVLPGAAAAAP